MGSRARKKSKFSRRVVLLFLFFILMPLSIGAGIGGYLALSRGVPSIAELKLYRSFPGTAVYADDDTLLTELKPRGGIFVSFKRMPGDLINAVVAVEDSNFWKHSGIDYFAIGRAAVKDVLYRHLKEGGSTITQQLAKITFLTPEKTIKRKLKEVILAMRIEKNLSKEEIIELYLNGTYFGHGAYGVEMASRVYFGKSVSGLSLPECALVAGLLKAPSKYSPFVDMKKARDRQEIALLRMEEEGFLTRGRREEALKEAVYFSRERGADTADNYFIEYVKKYLLEKYGPETVYKGGLRVYTTLNRKAQEAAKNALQEGLRAVDKRQGWRGPIERRPQASGEKPGGGFRGIPPGDGDVVTGIVMEVKENEALINASGVSGRLLLADAAWAANVRDEETGTVEHISGFSLKKILAEGDVVKVRIKSMRVSPVELALEQEPKVQGALVALEPQSGFIKALVGGYDFSKSEFNRAVSARRQPGSAFKPIIYSLALQEGFTPASIIVDEEVKYENGPEDIWIPQNFDETYHGPTRLREALTYSRNVVTVRLVEEIGVGRVIRYARNIGIKSEMPRDLTISLGSLSITPLDLTASYLIFANGGYRRDPIAVKYITDRRGRIIESNEPTGERVLDVQTAYLMTSMMSDVVRRGTGWRVKALGRPAAGKTGTTDEFWDAWFLGYTTELMTGVWVGFDELKSLGEETGSRAAAPVWLDFMSAVSSRVPEDFPVPEGITARLIDPETGLLANAWTTNAIVEHFRSGTEPTEYSESIWNVEQPENALLTNSYFY